MSRIAVLFPDINYSVEEPLFYYSKKVLEKRGFTVLTFHYDMSGEKEYTELFKSNPNATSQEFKEEIFEVVASAQKAGASQFKGTKWSSYEKVVFVSKGVGSVVASLFAGRNQINPVHIMYAPLEPSFQFISKEEGIVFCGMDDDFINYDRIKLLSRQSNMAVYRFDKCNHSLETGRIMDDIRNLAQILRTVDAFMGQADKTVYDFAVTNLDGEKEKLSKYQDKVLLIVNTATGCGFTPQYSKLEEIYELFHKQGFDIIDFPCNQFSNQAPGTSQEIHTFCTSRYNTKFPRYAKIDVNGEHEEELYTYLKSKRGFKGFDTSSLDGQFLDKKVRSEFPDYETSSDIKWNFTKFLVDKNGHVIERYEPTTDMNIIVEDIKRLL